MDKKIDYPKAMVVVSGILMAMAIYASLFTRENVIALTYGMAAIWGMMAANFYKVGNR